MPEISVIVPCYNGAEVLSRCIDSLVGQTIKLHQIIIVNDGSTDDSCSIARQYADRYDHIEVVTKENQGLPQARKTGVEHATGKYIGFVDCDDWCAPEMYEKLYAAICKQDVDIVCCGLMKIYGDGRTVVHEQMCPNHTYLSREKAFHLLHTRQDVFTYMCSKLFRREMLEGIAFPKGNYIGEDYATFVQILQKAQAVVTMKLPLYMYWQGDVSMSRGGFKPSHRLAYENYQKTEAWLLEENPEMQADICAYLSVEYMSFVIAMSRNGNYDQRMLKEIKKYVRRNLISLLKNKDFPVLYKGCAIAFSIHHKLMTTAYKVLTK